MYMYMLWRATNVHKYVVWQTYKLAVFWAKLHWQQENMKNSVPSLIWLVSLRNCRSIHHLLKQQNCHFFLQQAHNLEDSCVVKFKAVWEWLEPCDLSNNLFIRAFSWEMFSKSLWFWLIWIQIEVLLSLICGWTFPSFFCTRLSYPLSMISTEAQEKELRTDDELQLFFYHSNKPYGLNF